MDTLFFTDEHNMLIEMISDFAKSEIIPIAKEIDQTILDFRKKLYDINDEAGLKKIGKKLYNLIFKPLESHISPNKLIFISPDSNLHTLPFHALVTEQGDYLIKKYMFNYLNNGDDLTKIRKRPEPTSYKKIVLF